MRSRVVCFALMLAGLSAGVAAGWRWRPSPALPPAPHHYERVRLGMTPDEVAAALGAPPGYYDKKHPPTVLSMSPTGEFVLEAGLPHDALPDVPARPGDGGPAPLRVERWTWEDYWIWVAYDASESAVGCYLLESDYHWFQREGVKLLDPSAQR